MQRSIPDASNDTSFFTREDDADGGRGGRRERADGATHAETAGHTDHAGQMFLKPTLLQDAGVFPL